MSVLHPPRLATLLMERIAACPPALLGDLDEEFRAGRSRAWYWRETLHVIGRSLLGAVRSHPFTFLRAVVVLIVFQNVAAQALATVQFDVLGQMVPGWFYSRYQVYTLAWILVSFPIGVMASWEVARLYTDVRAPATLVVVIWSLVGIALSDAELWWLWANMPEPRFIPYFVTHVVGIAGWLGAMLVGGLFLPVRFRASTHA